MFPSGVPRWVVQGLGVAAVHLLAGGHVRLGAKWVHPDLAQGGRRQLDGAARGGAVDLDDPVQQIDDDEVYRGSLLFGAQTMLGSS